MAFNKAAEKSNENGLIGNSASRAVDGKIDTSVTGTGNPIWWRVDLGREGHVSAVYIVGFSSESLVDIKVGRLHLTF